MELNREQIKMALRCIAGERVLCKECAYNGENGMNCHKVAAREALAPLDNNEKRSAGIVAKIVIDDEKLEEIKNECLQRVELDIKQIEAETLQKMQQRFENAFSELDEYYSEDSYEAMVFSSAVLELLDKITNELLDNPENA